MMFNIDTGNYLVKAKLGLSRVLTLRAVSADITYKSISVLDTEKSAVIRIGDEKFLVGEQAIKQKNAQTIVEQGKHNPDVVLRYALSVLRENFCGTIRFSLPQRDRWIEDAIAKKLVGVHEVTVNDVPYQHDIEGIEFFLESDLAVKYAFSKGFIDGSGDCLGIDAGGGTVIYLIMSPMGEVLHRRSLPDVGGVSLANDIINSDLMQSYKYAFKPAKVMDAIADGSFMYGRRYDFSKVFQPLFDNWFNRLLDSIQLDCRDYLSDVSTIMFLGGNANLIKPLVGDKPGYFIPHNPHFANIEALAAM